MIGPRRVDVRDVKDRLTRWVNERLALKDCDTLEQIFGAGTAREALWAIEQLEDGQKDHQALNEIAEAVALDEHGTWTDESGILERVGYIVLDTGRSIEGWDE